MASPNRKISHSWSQSDISAPGSAKDGTNRSGQGIAVPAIATTNDKGRLGDLPRPPFKTGNSGSPSSSGSTTASQIQQITFTDEDIEDYKKNKSKPTWDTDRTYIQDSIIRSLLKLVIEEKMTDEMSGAGGVAGVVLPLGKSPDNFERPKKKRKSPTKVAGRTFGNAKPVNEKYMKIRMSELRQIVREVLSDDDWIYDDKGMANCPEHGSKFMIFLGAQMYSGGRQRWTCDACELRAGLRRGAPTGAEDLDEADLWNPEEEEKPKEAPRKSAKDIRGRKSY